jgi:hypothetical protein
METFPGNHINYIKVSMIQCYTWFWLAHGTSGITCQFQSTYMVFRNILSMWTVWWKSGNIRKHVDSLYNGKGDVDVILKLRNRIDAPVLGLSERNMFLVCSGEQEHETLSVT